MTLDIATVMGLIAGILAALVIGGNARRLGDTLGLLDFPDLSGGRKHHAAITPLVGGVAVLVALVAGVLLSISSSEVDEPVLDHVLWLGGGVLAMGFVGMTDDRFGLSAGFRLAIAVAVLAIMTVAAPDFSIDFLRFHGMSSLIILGGFGWLFTLLCLVGLLNAVNMADGKNGLVISLCLIWLAMLLPYMGEAMRPPLLAVMAALAMLLPFNMANRLFLGDSGSYALSALVGLSAVYAYNHAFDQLAGDRVALLLSVPVFDTIRLMTVRTLRGRSPFSPDRDHLHHHLYLRWGWPRGLLFYLALVIVPNMGGLLWPMQTPLFIAVSLLAYVAVIVTTSGTKGFRQEKTSL